MVVKNKTKINYWDIGKKIMFVVGFLGMGFGIFKGTVAIGKWLEKEENFKAGLEHITFTDAEQKIRTIDFINTKFNPITVFRQSDTLSKRTDTTIQLQKDLIQNQLNLDNLLDSIYRGEKIKEQGRQNREAKMDTVLSDTKKLLTKVDSILKQ